MADEILLRKMEYIAEQSRSWDELLRKTVELLYLNNERYHWVGIYLLEDDTLVLHNYMGKPTEHTRIPVGKGVCGTAVQQRENQLIGDVTKLENYLACSPETKSEIVVLIKDDERILGQIDIDSDQRDAFGPDDESFLNQIAGIIAAKSRQLLPSRSKNHA
ncbi:MAG: GAF domain-containing protein [Acidobacteriota bacterium]|nr:GAF domain-containing protein [Blastocatellia bacterium]MDW8238195.1 GAF domain-containing protein [Acidobacteriota bacterium]